MLKSDLVSFKTYYLPNVASYGDKIYTIVNWARCLNVISDHIWFFYCKRNYSGTKLKFGGIRILKCFK